MCTSSLKFTFEQPKDGNLQFLDLSLLSQANLLCWYFSPRSKKDIFNYSSSHSKIVKGGIAISILGSAMTKPCHHAVKDSCRSQFERLEEFGFPLAVLTEGMGLLLKNVKGVRNTRQNFLRKRPVVVPCLQNCPAIFNK